MELPVHLHHRPSAPQASLWPSLRPPSLAQSLLLLSQPCNPNPLRCRSFPSSPSAYLESSTPLGSFFNKVRGAIPVVGLLSRIFSDVGGVGDDRVQLIEFCTRVYKNFSLEQSNAFYDFEERYGKAARPQYVLIWCWAAALGAGLLKTEDFMLSAARLRVSFDIKYEEDKLNVLMDEAAEKRKLSKSKLPFVPYEVRAAKALDAICKCCIGRSSIGEEDAKLLTTVLQAVFPGADQQDVERVVMEKMTTAVHDSAIKNLPQGSGDTTLTSMKTKEMTEHDPINTSVDQLIEVRGQAVNELSQHEDKTQSLV